MNISKVRGFILAGTLGLATSCGHMMPKDAKLINETAKTKTYEVSKRFAYNLYNDVCDTIAIDTASIERSEITVPKSQSKLKDFVLRFSSKRKTDSFGLTTSKTIVAKNPQNQSLGFNSTYILDSCYENLGDKKFIQTVYSRKGSGYGRECLAETKIVPSSIFLKNARKLVKNGQKLNPSDTLEMKYYEQFNNQEYKQIEPEVFNALKKEQYGF